MKFKIILFLFLAIPQCVFGDTRCHLYDSEINRLDYDGIENYVRKFERDLRDLQNYVTETKLSSIAVTGFAEWVRTICDQNVNVEIFRFSAQNSISKIILTSDSISLHHYPQYSNIDIPALLTSGKILINVRILNFKELYAVQLTSLIPLQSSNDSELNFLRLNINNDFGLKLRTHFLAGRDTSEAINEYQENLDINNIVSFDGYIAYSFLSDFEWTLISSYVHEHSIVSLKKSKLPKSLSEIFGSTQ